MLSSLSRTIKRCQRNNGSKALSTLGVLSTKRSLNYLFLAHIADVMIQWCNNDEEESDHVSCGPDCRPSTSGAASCPKTRCITQHQ